jgi:hypothetical protein
VSADREQGVQQGGTNMAWTRGRVIGAAAVGAAVLILVGVLIGKSGQPGMATIPPETPPLPSGKVTNLPPELRKGVETAARGAMIHVFFHELGHALISELKLPATGPEEDVADEFATFNLTDALKAAPEDQKPQYAMLMWSGIVHWHLAAQQAGGDNARIVWYDEHPPDMRRYFSVLCLATGADPLRFIPMAVKSGVPESRLQMCAQEYATKHDAWNQLMAPHAPGFWSKLTGGHHLKLEYGPAGKSEYLAFEAVYREAGFQQLLDGISAAVDLPEDIAVEVKGCGQLNAWWDRRAKKITLCHDYFEHLVEIFAQNELAALAQQQQQQQGGAGGGQGGGETQTPIPQGTPAQGGTPTIAGEWVCQGNANGIATREQLHLGADGQFRSQLVNAMGQGMVTWGRWGLAGNAVRFDIVGVNPPVQIQSPLIVPFQMPQPNVIQTQTAVCQKQG